MIEVVTIQWLKELKEKIPSRSNTSTICKFFIWTFN